MREFMDKVERDLVPKMRESVVALMLVPEGETDAKFAVELGVAMMLDKPIILLVKEGHQVPEKLQLVADDVVYYAEMGADTAEAIKASVLRVAG